MPRYRRKVPPMEVGDRVTLHWPVVRIGRVVEIADDLAVVRFTRHRMNSELRGTTDIVPVAKLQYFPTHRETWQRAEILKAKWSDDERESRTEYQPPYTIPEVGIARDGRRREKQLPA